ncbi:DNA mismatch repair ATPase MutS [Pedobacter sp. UYP30]|uniref:MutS-related protein n=1 Tax=Pedobacter sp. UYP30 TaxID=1756400 RepID=UPI0033976CC4
MHVQLVSIVITFAILSLIVVYFFSNAKNKRAKILEKIREEWQDAKTDGINLIKLDWYMPNALKGFHEINLQTISDIDFHQLFAFVDRTTSKIGQQFLFHRLKSPAKNIAQLTDLDEQATFFNDNTAIRENVQLELSKLDHEDAYTVALLINQEFPSKPSWYNLLIVDVVVLVLSVVMGFINPNFFLLALFVMVCNATYLTYWNKKNILIFTQSLGQLNALINVSKKLAKKPIPFNNDLITEKIPVFKKVQRKIAILFINNNKNGGDISQIPVYLFEMIKGIFLVDIFTIFNLLKSLESNRKTISYLFEYVGSIDMAISLTALRSNSTGICKPTFTVDGKKLSVKNIIHPLVENCEPNSIDVENKSVLITGSNMSGKTTFLRTIAINSLLAQTIYTVFADYYEAPFLTLYSSIRIDDDLFTSKSYYLEEVTAMGNLVEAAKGEDQHLFIMDEVFKGTNTIERIAAAKSILSYLNQKNNIVFVSTHDIELADMLAKEFDLYHFTETIAEDELIFDHKLKQGPLKTKNAIRILQMHHYPTQIIEEAFAISKKLSSGKTGDWD